MNAEVEILGLNACDVVVNHTYKHFTGEKIVWSHCLTAVKLLQSSHVKMAKSPSLR